MSFRWWQGETDLDTYVPKQIGSHGLIPIFVLQFSDYDANLKWGKRQPWNTEDLLSWYLIMFLMCHTSNKSQWETFTTEHSMECLIADTPNWGWILFPVNDSEKWNV